MIRRLPSVLAAAVLLAAACSPRPPASSAREASPVDLAPLPEVPPLQIAQEFLPGSDGSLAVVASRPQGPATGIVLPSITFSKPVVALGTVAALRSLPPPARIDPPVAGEWRWLGSASVEFVPSERLPDGTRFTVTVPAGLRAVDGSVLAEPHVFSFETRRPVLVRVEPREGWSWVTPTSRFSIVFDRPVAELGRQLSLRAGGAEIPVRVTGEFRVADEERAARGPDAEELPPVPGWEDRRMRYEVTPSRPLPLDADVELSLSAELRGAEGPLPIGEGKRWRFRTYGPMRVTGAQACAGVDLCPYGPLIVKTTNPADVRTLRERVRIEPAAEIDWGRVEASEPSEWDAGWTPHFSLPGRFRPGVAYRVTIAGGFADAFGQAGGAAVVTARTSDLEPSFSMTRGAALLEAAGDGALPVEAENLRQLEATVWRLTPADVARLLSERPRRKGAGPALPAGPRVRSVDLGTERNVTKTRPIPIRQILGGARSALFYASVRAPELDPSKSPAATVVGQITDLAVHAKLGATRGVVWVTRLSDGKPAGGAAIAIHDATGKRIWTGKADGEGVCVVPGLGGKDEWSARSAENGWLVAATVGDDTGVTLSSWSGPFNPWFFGVMGDWDGTEPRSLGLVTPERGIYRPGQTVYVKGLARYRKLGNIETPPTGTRMVVKVTSSRGVDILTQEVSTTAFGTFSTRFALEGDVPLGTYGITATGEVAGGTIQYGGTFRVEEYRAPQFRVDVSVAERSVVDGDPIQGTVLARYLFGGPMADAEVAWTVNRSTMDFTPPGQEGFLFGNQVGFWDDREPGPNRGVAGSGKGRTDATGAFAIAAGRAEAPGNRTWETVVEAEVADVNRQRVAGRATLIVHPAALYAGVRRRGSGFAESGKPLGIDVLAVTPAGVRETADIEVVLKRREWRSIKKKVIGDRWMTVTEPVEEAAGTCRARASAQPGSCTFTPSAPGLHVAEATVTDARGRRQVTRAPFYVVGDGWVSWNRDDTDRVEMVADREVYEVGSTARILVKSPFPDAEGLLTVEREGVLEERRVRLGSAAATFEIPVTESSVPNVFASIVLVRGRQGGMPVSAKDDPGRPTVRIGYVQLRVERKGKRLQVALTVDGQEKRPRDKVKVDVQVRDAAGKGAESEVAIWAVDEGVLRLTGFKVPDPVEAIHPLRGLSVRVAESLVQLVLRRAYGDKGLAEGGSGGLDPSGSAFRTNFRTTAVFLPDVVTDASGHAQVEFELPDNLTTFRIMAIAITKGDRTGNGESKVVVAKPLLALPALPRLARVGDTFEAGVVVHAPGGKVRQAEVAASVTGLVLEGEARRKVDLPEGKAREVRFRFRAEKPGQAVLRFTVTGGGESDGVEQRIPVVLPVSREAVAVHGDTRDVRREALTPPSGVRPDVGGLELSLSSTAIAGLQEGMRQLVDYPYGCLEQLSSRLVPFTALRELSGKFGVTATPADPKEPDGWMRDWVGDDSLAILDAKNPDEVIRRTVKAIERLQGPDGGYRYWPGGNCSDELASAWAVLALGRAAALGFPVDGEALGRGQAYLSGTVAAGKCTECGFGCQPPPPSTRVFALWALARTGAPKASFLGALYDEREKLPLFARAMLADAMFVGGGNRAQARALLGEVLNQARVSDAEVHMEDEQGPLGQARWSSDVRTTAIVLQTLTDVSPDHPFVAKMAAWLVAARGKDGRYRNTQEAAFALSAMAEVVRTKEREVPDFTGTVKLGERRLAAVPFHGRSLALARSSVPIAELGRGGAPVPFEFRRDGRAGVLYYGALLRYAPEKMPVDPLDRGMFVQRWFEPWGGGGQVRTVRAGDLVRVTVRLGTPKARRDVAVEVPVPAGLEIVDTTLASTASAGGAPDFATGFWSPWSHVERRDDRLLLFADELPPGIHERSFVARATTPGTFLSRPAQAEEMYSPEVFGRSDGGTFVVLDPEAPGAR
ncbi:MAG: MG2 domain-containing protein [Deltaproteobacteria bacterium]